MSPRVLDPLGVGALPTKERTMEDNIYAVGPARLKQLRRDALRNMRNPVLFHDYYVDSGTMLAVLDHMEVIKRQVASMHTSWKLEIELLKKLAGRPTGDSVDLRTAIGELREQRDSAAEMLNTMREVFNHNVECNLLLDKVDTFLGIEHEGEEEVENVFQEKYQAPDETQAQAQERVVESLGSEEIVDTLSLYVEKLEDVVREARTYVGGPVLREVLADLDKFLRDVKWKEET